MVTRADLNGLSPRLLRKGRDYEPDLFIYDVNGEPIVVKDFARKDPVTRNLWGRISIRREAKALERLAGVPGVPQFRGRPDAFAVAMTYVESSSVSPLISARQGNERFVRELEAIVAAMHERGVLHMDLKHRTNIVVTTDGHPVVLDFTSSMRVNPRWFGGRWARWLFGGGDRIALRKWKRQLAPDLLTPREKRRAEFERKLRRLWLPRLVTDLFVKILPRPPKRLRKD
jgi:predicted Ser/Thr protein kinase